MIHCCAGRVLDDGSFGRMLIAMMRWTLELQAVWTGIIRSVVEVEVDTSKGWAEFSFRINILNMMKFTKWNILTVNRNVNCKYQLNVNRVC